MLVGRGEQIHHIRSQGLRYVRPEGVRRVRIETSIGIEATSLRPDDLLVLAMKTQDVEDAARSLAWKPIVGSDDATSLPVLTLQNGMSAERVLLRWFPHVYAGSLRTPARYIRTGEVSVSASPKLGYLVLGRAPRGTDSAVDEIAAIFRDLDLLVQTDDDVLRWKAYKLLNSVGNGLDVLRGTEAEKSALYAELVQETRAALTAAGIGIASAEEWKEDWSLYRRAPSASEPSAQSSTWQSSTWQSSTWQSFARGAERTEVDYLNGEVVLLGRLYGVPTPHNAAMQKVLGRASLRKVRPGGVDVAEVLDELHAPQQAPQRSAHEPLSRH